MPGQRRTGFARIAVMMHGAAPTRARFATLAATRGPQAATTGAPERSSIRATAPTAPDAPATAPTHAGTTLSRSAANLPHSGTGASLEAAPEAAEARPSGEVSADDLFREWAERLEQAAEELGIEIGD